MWQGLGADSMKLMAEWFWIDRWEGSSAAVLPLEARGLYRELLSLSWKKGARLPNKPEELRALLRVKTWEWKRSWPLVAPYWRVDGEFLVNDTQLEVYGEAVKRSSAASEKAKRAVEAREARRGAAIPGSSQDDRKIMPPSPSPSPSPSPTRTTATDEEEEAPARVTAPPPPADPVKAEDVTEGNRLIEAISDRWPDLDPTNVIRRASYWPGTRGGSGSSLTRLDLARSGSRVLHTVDTLRTWLNTGRTPEQQRDDLRASSGSAPRKSVGDRAIDEAQAAIEIIRARTARPAVPALPPPAEEKPHAH